MADQPTEPGFAMPNGFSVAGGSPGVGGRAVAEIVHQAHEDGIEAALAAAPFAGDASRDDMEAVFIYCAERRCESDGATCPGCRLRTVKDGIASLDDFIAQFSAISIEETGHALRPGGPREAITVPNFARLAETWRGEEYWFWARRVLRKLRYGVRKSETLFESGEAPEDGPAVILVAPQIAENIGMVARAMANFGLDELRVVEPRDGWPSEKARATASGAAAIVDGAQIHDTFTASKADLTFVVATTARQRDMRKPILTPEQAADEIRRRTDAGERCGLVFGRERNGLQSDEVADCDAVVMIPVNPKFASLNLAQAVLLLGYAWFSSSPSATLGRVTARDRRISPGLHLGHDVPAKHAEVERFFAHIEGELDARGFFNPPERRHVTVRNLRSMFRRMGATAQEVRTLRGIVATLVRPPRNPRGS
ncbi:MAG: RNA methyltransferase [Pseudomonadota bacterium]